ncbi:hypothetical protein BBK36DRAFT_1172701 [Trichoderma citrinoviride]|uniref:Uncharacterized protein n=1 Tax=Trichoderma citrinoviride TaxID=58853 RepID=A0A2T4AYI9_9HYPO|nr:hypothetical protein BBK36DRAFT_1172701 [Trichoderma citrinoviride]PTB62134.1 hypothetical protein BBK36DRAFT_1172701 [Trichoderma citrinoviride]
MDDSPYADTSGLLVTAANPAHDDLPGIDHSRSEGRPPTKLHGINKTFFTAYGNAAEALRKQLNPSLIAFLAAAQLPPNDHDNINSAPFLICLYYPNIGHGGERGGGLLYHQGHHRAAVLMHMDDYDYVLPFEAHRELWHPLETVLSNWISLIHLGKAIVTASPRDEPGLFGNEKIGPWEWRPYSEAQVSSCVDAWNQLCEAIEERIPSKGSNIDTNSPQPLLASSALDTASIPDPCFARSFLTSARRPCFQRIAPGLFLPPADAAAFAAIQPFTGLPRSHGAVIPPVCLFPAAPCEREAVLTASSSPFCGDFRPTPANSAVPSKVRAGVYSESVDRNSGHDYAEEGFRLLLPYGFDNDWNGSDGARKSDGSLIDRGKLADLFQHGYKPFGGDYYRPQRLERLLDCWCKLIEEGVWSVGPEGVQGTIDKFKDAGTTHWRDYVIPLTW